MEASIFHWFHIVKNLLPENLMRGNAQKQYKKYKFLYIVASVLVPVFGNQKNERFYPVKT